MRQKFNFLEGVCPITSGINPTEDLIKKNIIPTVKHGGGSVMSGAALQLQDLDDWP